MTHEIVGGGAAQATPRHIQIMVAAEEEKKAGWKEIIIDERCDMDGAQVLY